MVQRNNKSDSADENLLDETQRRGVIIINKVQTSVSDEQKLERVCHNAENTQSGRILQRWVFATMGCLAVTVSFMIRIGLNITITEMTAKIEIRSNDTYSFGKTCPVTTEAAFSRSSSGGTYQWDEYTQGIVLSSFHWGFLISHVAGGMLAQKFGGKQTLGLSVLFAGIFTILTPIVVRAYGATGLAVLRALTGLSEGLSFPALSFMVAQWAPPLEQSKINTMAYTGVPFGTVLGNALSGVLIQSFSIGWPIVFYVYGALGILWYFPWVVLCYSSPDVHPFITEDEKKYINESTKKHTHRVRQPVPWRYMLTSVPMWATMVAKLFYAFAYYVMATDLPKYMSSVLHFSIQTNGLLLAFPYLLNGAVGIGISWLADWLIKEGIMTRTNTRKILNTAAILAAACFLLGASYAGCDRIIVVILFTLCIGLMSVTFSTVMVNIIELSPNYSGNAMGLASTVSSFAGIVVPYAVGIMTPTQTLSEWKVVFWIAFAVLLLSAAIFGIWGDCEVQHWNDLSPCKNQQSDVQTQVPHSGDVLIQTPNPTSHADFNDVA